MMFREEALSYRADRLSGEVAIAVPISWQLIGYGLLVGLGVSALFVSIATYDRVETVQGSVVPDTGIAAIMPSRSGVTTMVNVHEGQFVAKGQQLAAIRVDEDLGQGGSAAALAATAVGLQDANLAAQAEASMAAAHAQQSQIAAQRVGLDAEIGELRAQIDLQKELVASAKEDLARVRGIAAQGFISRRDIQSREDLYISRQQQMSQLKATLQTKTSGMIEAERTISQLSSQARSQSAGIAVTRAQVAQQAATLMSAQSYILRAPVAGRITGLAGRVGQVATPQTTLMSIVPAASTLRAELLVPSGAIGFVRPGQEVRLALDAFPYQRFGIVTGRIETIAQNATTQPGAVASGAVMYPVTVTLNQSSISAYGRSHGLMSGMTLTARIVTERQTLLEWLFDPLFAIRKR